MNFDKLQKTATKGLQSAQKQVTSLIGFEIELIHVVYAILILISLYLIYLINKHPQVVDNYFDFGEWRKVNRTVPTRPTIINIKNYQFWPDYIIVPLGSEICWINLDETEHQIVGGTSTQELPMFEKRIGRHAPMPQRKPFKSPRLKTDQYFKITFNEEGTYHYYSVDHPKTRGTIVVVGEN